MPTNPRDILQALGNLAAGLQAAPAGVPGRIWQELGPWLSRLALHAAPKWVPRMGFGFPCHVPIYQGGKPVGPCPRPAIAACDVCGEPVCLDHARIDQLGDAICYLCVNMAMHVHRVRQAQEAAQQAAASGAHAGQDRGEARPPPGANKPPERSEVVWARRMLKVTKSATWDEIKKAHRMQSGKWHPDRHQGEKQKQDAEQRFKDVQRALGVLEREKAAASAAA